jgi:RTX calcium-binding nonapeptide repeat (4 copies)
MAYMRRFLSSAVVLLALGLPAAAQAGEASGELVSCTGSDICRYFPNERRLDVTFEAAPGEVNELSVLPDPGGVRFGDDRAAITPGDFCAASTPNVVLCGPPASSGLLAIAFTGDRADTVLADTGTVFLEEGSDHGIAEGGSLFGGSGNDRLISATRGSLLSGGAGRDLLTGVGADDIFIGDTGEDRIFARGGADSIDGGPGADFLAGGPGRDEIRAAGGDDRVHAADRQRDIVDCGRGQDRAVVRANDRVFHCERVIYRERG